MFLHADGKVQVLCKRQEAMDTPFQQGTLLFGGVGILVWELLTYTEMKVAVRMTSSVTGQRCRDMCNDHVLLILRLQQPTKNTFLQQDNAQRHRF